MTIIHNQFSKDVFEALSKAEQFILSLTSDSPSEKITNEDICNILKPGVTYRKVTNDNIFYKLNIAGYKKENIEIVLNDITLTINIIENDKTIFRKNIPINDQDIEVSKIKSSYIDGILEITVPRNKENNRINRSIKID
jgi:hypothetical protein